MKSVLLFTVMLFVTAWAPAQQSPPAATGIGNATTSPNSNVGNNPSFSPDQNQATTDTRGSTTGDKSNPDFAGGSGRQTSSTALSQGDVGATGSTSATATRGQTASTTAGTATPPRKKNAKAHHTHRQARKGPSNTSNAGSAQQTYSAPVFPEQGPSTTEAPGPSTGAGTAHPQPPKNPD